MNILNSLWVEKYRPKKLEELILPEDYRIIFEKSIEKKDIANFLFYGSPGGGKTALARILSSKNGVLLNANDNLLEINGSSKEGKSINCVQDIIEPFLKIPPAGSDKNKIVFIDEADFMTSHSFHSLRHIIEKYSSYGRFIITCNYMSKIPEAIQSRFQSFIFKQLPLDFVISYCVNILKNEEIKYIDDDIKYVVKSLFPDIRRIVNTLQKCSASGKLMVTSEAVLTTEKIVISSFIDIISAIKDGQKQKINKFVSIIIEQLNKTDLEYRSIYSDLFKRKQIPVPVKIVVNKYANNHGDCLVPAMHFSAMIFESIKALGDYGK